MMRNMRGESTSVRVARIPGNSDRRELRPCRTAVIMTHDVERVLADIDADHGDRCVEFLRHGVLLVLSAPCQLLILAGPEHGRTIPLAEHAHNVWLVLRLEQLSDLAFRPASIF